MERPHLATRREMLLASGVLFAWAYMPSLAQAEGRDPRFLVIVLHGALDGLATVAPVGDPNWVRLRVEERNALAAIASGGLDEIGHGPKPVGPLLAYFTEAASGAARFMARPDGPRAGALAFDGWDTHANEGAAHGRLSVLLGALDGALAAIEGGMSAAWKETVVAVITEFGRTARINGTEGTDHGTATVALLAGAALKGGRVIADWPGVADAALYQGRDLKPTADLRAVMKGILRDHLRADERALAQYVFPDSETVKSLDGLMA